MTRTAAKGEIRVLGPLEVTRDRTPIALRPAQRRLLAILLVDPTVELDRDSLEDRMWGDELPPTAASALQVHLSGLRRALPDLLVSTGQGYRLSLTDYAVDRATFESLAARAQREARAGSWARVLKTVGRALAEWRGPPFELLGDDLSARATVAHLETQRATLAELGARARLALGQHEEAIIELRGLLRQHPLDEALWGRLMEALSAAGRPAEALHAFQEARRGLADELGVEPGMELRRLEERIVQGDTTDHILEPGQGFVPIRRTSFVGREEDVRHIARLLERNRIVSVVGGPGLGKTRLALEAAHVLRPVQRDGAWFVDLSPARTTQEVISAIAGVLDLRTQAIDLGVLADRIRAREGLIVLDNCEHVAATCADLLRLVLERAGPVRILATSRSALGVAGEHAWTIRPLTTPPADMASATGVLRFPAVRLFLDRARAVDRTYRITDASAPRIAGLCRRTDGVPLAVELAAAWTSALGPREIEEMLGGDEPAPGARPHDDDAEHHRSLRAALEWSIALLAPEDRELFDAAAVFRGTFSLGDAVAVWDRAEQRRRTAAAIGRLVAASLLIADRRENGDVVYRSLVPIRELARNRLEGRSDWPRIRERFVSHYLERGMGPQDDPFRAVTDLAAIDEDIDNLREAFEMGLAEGRANEVARAIISLDGYFVNRYLAREQRTWLERVLPMVSEPEIRAHALVSAALASQATNRLDDALGFFDDALREFRELADSTGMARCLLALAGLHSNRGSWQAGLEAAREGRQLVTGLGSPSSLGIASYYVGTNLAYSGRVAEGIVALEESAEHFRRSGELGRVSQALSTAAYLAVLGGDEARAASAAGEAVALARRSGSEVRLTRALSAAATVQARWGEQSRARRMFADVHDRLRFQANEDLFEFLLPAGILLRREGAWDELVPLVHAVEAAIAESGQGYPVPWRDAVESWLADAAAAAASPVEDVPEEAPTVAAVRAHVRRHLDPVD